tara:strand:- start:274 stop:999 length:726 start_codon:yes stop_codon:yes gene_type:complete
MATQTFSQFVGITAPLDFHRSRTFQRPRHGQSVDLHQLSEKFFDRTKPSELRIEKNGQTFGLARFETEYMAKDTPAGFRYLHGLSYELTFSPGIEFSILPLAAKLFFDDYFGLRAVKFDVARDFEKEHFEAVFDQPARFHHIRMRMPERSKTTTTGNEPWRTWFALASQASPRSLETILHNIRPDIQAHYDQTYAGTIVSAKLGLFPVPLSFFLDETGELIRIDQIPSRSEIVLNAPPSPL